MGSKSSYPCSPPPAPICSKCTSSKRCSGCSRQKSEKKESQTKSQNTNQEVRSQQVSETYFLKQKLSQLNGIQLVDKVNEQVLLEVYSRPVRRFCQIFKHCGVVINFSNGETWCLEYFQTGLQFFKGEGKKGKCQKTIEQKFLLSTILSAVNKSKGTRQYNRISNNCNDWVQRFFKNLGYPIDISNLNL